MKRGSVIAIVLAAAALAAVVATTARSGAKARGSRLHVATGCPSASEENPSQGLADQAVAAARAVVIDHKVAQVQGRTYRRNRENTPLLQLTKLGEIPLLAGQKTLQRAAERRCGKELARWSWALVFGDQATTMCCIRTTVFVVHVKDGWRVY
jgi:hypothetical protein